MTVGWQWPVWTTAMPATKSMKRRPSTSHTSAPRARRRARLASGVWVAAYLARLRLAGLAAYVVAKGDPTAGAVVVKIVQSQGRARAMVRRFDFETGARLWQVLAEGAEAEVDAVLQRERGRDRDLWVIDVEDATGAALLDAEGLASD